MKLAIDIGNTSTSVALFEHYNIVKKTHFSSISAFNSFLDSIRDYDIESAIISSVVPKLTSAYTDLLTDPYQHPIFIINHNCS